MNGTITEWYRKEQQKLHAREEYGTASLAYAPLVRSVLEHGCCTSLSDYGAGKGNLRQALADVFESVDYRPFDPAFPDYGEPRSAELVTCIDVLEHVEPETLDACLNQLASITERLVLFTVRTGPAKKTLSDGRNAHLIQEPLEWWLPRLSERFDLIRFQAARKGFFVLGCAKGLFGALDEHLDLVALSEAADAAAPPPISGARLARLNLERSTTKAKLEAGVLWLAARDPRTPWQVKIVAGLSSFLALSPIDLTPDFIPMLGYLDDVLLLVLGTLIAKRMIPPDLLAELRLRAATVDYAMAMKGAAAVSTLWFGAMLMAVVHGLGSSV